MTGHSPEDWTGNAVETSGPAWEYPGQDWCQSHCYQQTGHKNMKRKTPHELNEKRDNRVFTVVVGTHLIIIIDFVSSPLSCKERKNKSS